MNDTIAGSRGHLLELLYDIPRTLGGDFTDVGRPLLRSFRKYAEPGSIPADSLWGRLSVAQHHGLPTRVLDRTASPKVALHFATWEEDHYDKDGAIWCVDVVKARIDDQHVEVRLISTTELELPAANLPTRPGKYGVVVVDGETRAGASATAEPDVTAGDPS